MYKCACLQMQHSSKVGVQQQETHKGHQVQLPELEAWLLTSLRKHS